MRETRTRLEEDFIEFESIRKNRRISKSVDEGEHSILGAPSLSCVPIFWAVRRGER